MAQIADIHRHPVKGWTPESLEKVTLQAGGGVPFDRHFAFTNGRREELPEPGKWVQAREGDLVRMPRGIPHGYFNNSDEPARALFWVSPAGKLEALFRKLHNLTDTEKVVAISAEHDVEFLPPEANQPID